MLCRVCKRDLGDNAVCSFCGEDNTPYIEAAKEEAQKKSALQKKVEKTHEKKMGDKEPKARVVAKVKSEYRYDKKKVIRFYVCVAAIIAAIIVAVSLLIPKEDKEAIPQGETLFSSGMLGVSSKGQWGYVNIEDPSFFAIVPQFTHISDYHGDVAAILIGDKFSFIDKVGTLICEPTFDSVGEFGENGYIAVEEDGKWGYVDINAQYVIEPKFATAYGFGKNGMAAVSVSGSYGYIGEDGEYTIAPQYDMALSFGEDGLAPVKTDGKWGYIDETGTALIEPKYEEAYHFENGYAVVKQYGEYGLIDSEGKMVIPPQFDERFSFDGELALVKAGGKYGYIDITGSYKINPRFKSAGEFGTSNLAFAKRSDGKFGFIDKNGDYAIKPMYDGAKNFSMGLAPVKKDGLWGYVDAEGNEIIEAKYMEASEFYADGFAWVRNVDSSITIINTDGKTAMMESAAAIDNILR